MNTANRFIATAATALLVIAAPAAAHQKEPEQPTKPPAESQGPPPSTHGAFLPFPDDYSQPYTLPACGSEITVGPGDVDEQEYRVLVDAEGNTVMETRGAATADITRASDGAMLDEVEVSGGAFETISADGTSVTYNTSGASIIVAFDEAETQAFEEAGLPQAFFFLSGELTETVTFESTPPQPGQDAPQVVSAEVTEDSTKYVFDLCDLLDQASAGEATPAA